MSLGKYALSATLLVATASLLIAADPPKAPPTTQATKSKLVEPWSLLTNLTAEQTTQIEKIHADALEQEKKIRQKETDDITALLTPEQQTQLKLAEAKHKVEAKDRAAKKKLSTTEPMK